MHLGRVRQHVLDARLDRLVADNAVVGVQAEQHTLVREVAVRGIRELAERQVRVEMAAENLIVFLPEAPLHREPHLRAVAVRRGSDRRHHLW